MKNLRAIGWVLLLALTLPFNSACIKAQTNHNFELVKNLDIFTALYRELDRNYVDTLNSQKLIENAVLYMLGQLDPYTEFYPESNTDDLRQMTTGKYAGIGSTIMYRPKEKHCILTNLYENMPAAKAGLRPGDVILSVDGEPLAYEGKQKQEEFSAYVSGKLRGEPGTTIELKVQRPVADKDLTFKVTRENIVIPSVSLHTMVADSIGYLHLNGYVDGTSEEVRRAIVDLKKQGAKAFILNLCSNPGGVVDEAVKTVNLFLPRGKEVVSRKGKTKESNYKYKTTDDPLDPSSPLVVLTDFGSASASEITSGALQDYDRAVIMGQRTYGKGLVQQSLELPYNTAVKLTTARYYLPSGRCVQAYEFKDGEPVHLPDSLTKEFRTAAGRIVRDGGGITPDIEVKEDSMPALIPYLVASDQLTDYCVRYRNTHDTIASPTEFRLTDEEYTDFTEFMRGENFTYDRQSLKALDVLRKIIQSDGLADEAKAELDALEAKLKSNLENDFKRYEPIIRFAVESNIVEYYYYNRGRGLYNVPRNNMIKEAIKLLQNPDLYRRVLNGEPAA